MTYPAHNKVDVQPKAAGGKSSVDTAIHAGMVCQPDRMADTQERPQDIRVSDVERPQAETILRGWAFALRDLSDQGAEIVTARLDGGALVTYTRGKGAAWTLGRQTIRLEDDELDDVGYVPTDAALSSKQQWNDVRPEEAE